MKIEMKLIHTSAAGENPYYWIEQRVYELKDGGFAVAMATKSGIDPNTFFRVSKDAAEKIIGVK